MLKIVSFAAAIIFCLNVSNKYQNDELISVAGIVSTIKKILILGIGNTLRGDDGIGAYVCNQVETMKMVNVATHKVQQLQVELLDMMIDFDRVLIVDAGINVRKVIIEVVTDVTQPHASSHHSDPAVFKALAKQLYQKDLNIYSCAIPVQSFEMGEGLTKFAEKNANEAVQLIKDWCQSG